MPSEIKSETLWNKYGQIGLENLFDEFYVHFIDVNIQVHCAKHTLNSVTVRGLVHSSPKES